MLKDVRAAVDRLAQRVDGMESPAGGPASAAQPPALAILADCANPPSTPATDDSTNARTHTGKHAGACQCAGSPKGQRHSGGGHRGGGRSDRPESRSVRAVGQLDSCCAQEMESDGPPVNYFPNLPFAQASFWTN